MTNPNWPNDYRTSWRTSMNGGGGIRGSFPIAFPPVQWMSINSQQTRAAATNPFLNTALQPDDFDLGEG